MTSWIELENIPYGSWLTKDMWNNVLGSNTSLLNAKNSIDFFSNRMLTARYIGSFILTGGLGRYVQYTSFIHKKNWDSNISTPALYVTFPSNGTYLLNFQYTFTTVSTRINLQFKTASGNILGSSYYKTRFIDENVSALYTSPGNYNKCLVINVDSIIPVDLWVLITGDLINDVTLLNPTLTIMKVN